MKRFLLPILVALLVFLTVLTINSRVSDAKKRASENAAQIASLRTLQAQELATFTLLQNTLEGRLGPKATAAQAAAIKKFLDDMEKRIQIENAALLSAIQHGSHVIVVTKTVTVCRTPSGKSC